MIREMLTLHEGRIPHAYQDSLGYWTIGIGHLIDRRLGGTLPDKIIDDLFEYDLAKKTDDLLTALPWVADLDEVRRAVLIDMTFNMGIGRLLGFRNTLAAIQRSDYADAATRMLDSKWATQVGRRATRLSEMMRTGEWAKDIPGVHRG